MKRYLALFLFMLLTDLGMADSFRLRNGTTVTGTLKRGGGGQVILETSDGVITYKIADFDEATQARLAHYNAATPAPPLIPRATPAPATPSAPAIEREEPTAKSRPVHLRKFPQSPEDFEALNRQLEGPRLVVFYVGVGLMIIGGLWFLVRTFQQSIWWGLGSLLCGIVTLFFLFAHWDRAKDPFFMQLAGIALSFGAVYLMN